MHGPARKIRSLFMPGGKPDKSGRRMLPTVAGMLLFVTAIGGCNLLTPLIFIGEHKKQFPAEFDKLPNSRVAVVVWMDQSTLFDWPFARFELATYVADKLDSEISQRGREIDIVDPRDIDDFIQRSNDPVIDPITIGREFDVDYVLYVEVLEYQTRDSQQPQLLRGRIGASVSVVDIRSDADLGETFELAAVKCVHPEQAPVLMNATNTRRVREATHLKFSELVARKFYQYEEDL